LVRGDGTRLGVDDSAGPNRRNLRLGGRSGQHEEKADTGGTARERRCVRHVMVRWMVASAPTSGIATNMLPAACRGEVLDSWPFGDAIRQAMVQPPEPNHMKRGAVMTTRTVRPCRPLSSTRAAAIALTLLGTLAGSASAQLVQIKTLPMAEGDQFAFWPSANQGMGGLSLSLPDSLLDPFLNPAKGARLKTAQFFGSPTFYSLSRNAGGGQTLPLGGLVTSKRSFGGALVALQQVDKNRSDVNLVFPGLQLSARDASLTSSSTAPPVFPNPEQSRSQQNNYGFAMYGQRFERARVSLAASIFLAGLRRIDGVDLLYAGSQSVRQRGKALDMRLGALKEWEGGKSLDAVVLHGRLDMAHDVAFADQFWDPNLRITSFGPRFEHNIDRSTTWGLHLAYQRPIADSGWRMGAVLTTNLLSHPKLPNYEIAQVVQ